MRDIAKATPCKTSGSWTKELWQCWGISVLQITGTKELHYLSVVTGFQEWLEALAGCRHAAWSVSSLRAKGPQCKDTVCLLLLRAQNPLCFRISSSLLKHKAMWRFGAGIQLSYFSNYCIFACIYAFVGKMSIIQQTFNLQDLLKQNRGSINEDWPSKSWHHRMRSIYTLTVTKQPWFAGCSDFKIPKGFMVMF